MSASSTSSGSRRRSARRFRSCSSPLRPSERGTAVGRTPDRAHVLQEIRETVAQPGGPSLTFSLHRKSSRLGPVTVDHWWMPVTELYRQRRQAGVAGGNHEAVI